MAITEASRHTMLEALRAAIGEDEAMTLAEHLPPVGWADVATKADIAEVRGDLRSTEERLGHRIDTVDADLRAFEVRVDLRFDKFEETVRADINTALYRCSVGTFASLGILMTAISIFG